MQPDTAPTLFPVASLFVLVRRHARQDLRGSGPSVLTLLASGTALASALIGGPPCSFGSIYTDILSFALSFPLPYFFLSVSLSLTLYFSVTLSLLFPPLPLFLFMTRPSNGLVQSVLVWLSSHLMDQHCVTLQIKHPK